MFRQTFESCRLLHFAIHIKTNSVNDPIVGDTSFYNLHDERTGLYLLSDLCLADEVVREHNLSAAAASEK